MKLIKQKGDDKPHIRGTMRGRSLCNEVLSAPRLVKTGSVRVGDICRKCLIAYMRRETP